MGKLYKNQPAKALKIVIALCVFVFGTQSIAIAQCDTPTNLVANNVMGGNADLSWDAVAGAESYEVRYRIFGDAFADPSFTTVAVMGTMTTITGLTNGVVYSGQVRAICSAANGIESTWTSGVIFSSFGGATCNTPTNLMFSNVMPTSADFDWDAVSGAVSYDIRYRVVGTMMFTTMNVMTNSATITGLNSSSRYQVQVKALCTADGSLASTFSDGVIFRSASCVTPTNLTVDAENGTEVDLSWDATVDALSYEVRFAEVGTMAYTTVTSMTNSVTLTGIDPDLRYQAQVRSFCSADMSRFSFFSDGVTFGPETCDAPMNLAASNLTDETVDITWDDVAGATSYLVRYRPDGLGAFTTVAAMTNSASITGLSSETEYQVQVRAFCKADNSIFSVFSSGLLFTTEAPPSANFVMKSFPNPFVQTTTVSLTGTTSNYATLGLYNMDGVEVRTIYQGALKSDENYQFELNAGNLKEGLYFYKLVTQEGDVVLDRVVLNR